jgi:predicted HAD superfamily Cof-like phosphohydrolase
MPGSRGEFTMMSIRGIQGDVESFMREVAHQELPTRPTTPHPAIIQMRIDLITEEAIDETVDVLDQLASGRALNKLEEMALWAKLADGIVDSIVVLVGTASAFGIDLEDIWELVHASNMAKKGGPVREDGKRLKPIHWQEPNILGAIREQVAEADFADRSIT